MQGVVRSYSKPDPHGGNRLWNFSTLKTIEIIKILLNTYKNGPSFNTFKQSHRSLCKKNSFAKKTTLDLFNNQSSDLCPCHNKDGMSWRHCGSGVLLKWREAITTENILCLPLIVFMPFQKELSYSKIDKTNALKRIAFPLMNLRIDHFCLHGHKIKLSECFMILFIIHFLSDFP